MVENFRKPNLLIGNYEELIDIEKKILENEYICIDDNIPVCRFRGTYIKCIENDKLNIIVWQRNVARIRRMDVSLPTIIKLIVNKDKIIEEVSLNETFKGSKGLFCSQKYLNKNLAKMIKGQKIDRNFLKIIKVDNMHCFHLTEVLGGLYSYMESNVHIENLKVGDELFDEEVTDSYLFDKSLVASGEQYLKGEKSFNYYIVMKDILDNISFQKNGFLNIEKETEISFFIDSKNVYNDILNPVKNELTYVSLTKLAVKFINEIKKYLGLDKKFKMINTNLMPAAFIGLLIQSLCVRQYQNSYDYTMHVLTTIQRHKDIPICIGAIKGMEEGMEYFPDFDIKEIL